jgi:hypothetical protein
MSDIVERLRETIVAYDTWYQGQLKTSDTLLERFSRERHEAAEEITHLRAENEKLEDTRIEFIGMINKLIDERVKMRKALNPFAATAKHFKEDCKDTLVVKIGVDVGYLRAAAAAIRESGE